MHNITNSLQMDLSKVITDESSSLRYLPLSYNNANSEQSALRLILSLRPEWQSQPGPIEIVRFTDGITNTLLKLVKKVPGWSSEQIDEESVLMRAYGNNSEILIDRNREATSHALLSEHGLAPPLHARFKNGLLYSFIRGRVCSPNDLTREPVWRAVARRIAEWHARVPVTTKVESPTLGNGNGFMNGNHSNPLSYIPRNDPKPLSGIATRPLQPNIWTVLQRWIDVLPTTTEAEKSRKALLNDELQRSFHELDSTSGLGNEGLVFGHCDLLSANVIILPATTSTNLQQRGKGQETVSFIDYEYATPCPAAFDIANHFAEWGGYDCDYTMLPTKSVRQEFLREYLEAYQKSSREDLAVGPVLEKLAEDVDRYRGMPGFYWGIWALIQATISQIDFDYASYAEVRLGEYWAWREETTGLRKKEGRSIPLRETRWAQEA